MYQIILNFQEAHIHKAVINTITFQKSLWVISRQEQGECKQPIRSLGIEQVKVEVVLSDRCFRVMEGTSCGALA